MRPSPDFQGFADAQETLRTTFGRSVRFYGPADVLYDPSIPASEFDDEGIPLDPLVGASAVNPANVEIENLTLLGSAMVNVVLKPLQTSILRQDRTVQTQLGIRSQMNKDLILNHADYPLASGATYFQVGTADSTDQAWQADESMLWKVVNVLTDDSFGIAQRVIVYGEATR